MLPEVNATPDFSLIDTDSVHLSPLDLFNLHDPNLAQDTHWGKERRAVL